MPYAIRMMFAALLILPLVASAGAQVTWPHGAKVAVSLSYDDALDSQLDHAAPALDRHGFKATFYVTIGNEAMLARSDAWQALARNGHELGNHTIYHPCRSSLPDREWVQPYYDLDTYSLEQLRRELMVTNTFLEALDGQSRRSFAATCSDMLAGGEPYLPAVADLFGSIRDVDHGMARGAKIVWGPDPGISGTDLVRFVADNSRPGTMLGIVFHGVGGDYLSVSAEAHEALLEFLAANRETYWVDTYVTIMDHVQSQLDDADARPE